MVLGKLPLAFLGLLCGIAHGWGELGVSMVASGVVDSSHAMSAATGRALTGLRRIQEGIRVQSLKQGSWSRRILGNKDGLCTWEDGECGLSPRVLSLAFEESDSLVAQIGKIYLECQSAEDKESCSTKKCTWDLGECQPSSDMFSLNTFEDCLGDFAPLAEIGYDDATCGDEISSKKECTAEKACAWDDDDGECSVDVWQTLLQIPSENGMPKGVDEAMLAMQDTLRSAAFGDISLFLNPDPTVFLDWVPPDFECPEGVDQRVCDFVAPAKELFGVSIYCSKKYEKGQRGCEADPKCTIEDGECGVSSTVSAGIQKKQMEAIVSSFTDVHLRGILIQVMSCGIQSKDTCIDACMWDEQELECSINESWLGGKLAEEAAKSKKPICKMFASIMALGCQYSEGGMCSENPKCEWKNGDCDPTDSATVQIGLESDPVLEGYFSLHQECAAAEKKAICLSL